MSQEVYIPSELIRLISGFSLNPNLWLVSPEFEEAEIETIDEKIEALINRYGTEGLVEVEILQSGDKDAILFWAKNMGLKYVGQHQLFSLVLNSTTGVDYKFLEQLMRYLNRSQKVGLLKEGVINNIPQLINFIIPKVDYRNFTELAYIAALNNHFSLVDYFIKNGASSDSVMEKLIRARELRKAIRMLDHNVTDYDEMLDVMLERFIVEGEEESELIEKLIQKGAHSKVIHLDQLRNYDNLTSSLQEMVSNYEKDFPEEDMDEY